jgi:hypothetical protein
MKECIINVAVGPASHYVDWQRRLAESLDAQNFRGKRMFWTDCLPPASPTHEESPYAFKPYAFEAAREAGCTQILWCDSAIWARRPLDRACETLKNQGYLLFYNGYLCGNWCTDAALAQQGLSRDEAMAIPDFTGCCMGLDLESPIAVEFLRQWKAAADDGISFVGDWKNDGGQCSPDKRCHGHRHDQVIGSIIAHRLGMKPIHGGPGGLFSYYRPDLDRNAPEVETICLVNNR